MRLGINRTWDSRWYANKGEYGDLLHEDFRIREFLLNELKQAAVSKVVIERPHSQVPRHHFTPVVRVWSSARRVRTSSVFARRSPRSPIRKCTSTSLKCASRKSTRRWSPLRSHSSWNAVLPFRRAMKRAVQSAMRLGAQGIRINCGGRLGGAEIARIEWYREGRVPLHNPARRHRLRCRIRSHRLRCLRREGVDLQG